MKRKWNRFTSFLLGFVVKKNVMQNVFVLIFLLRFPSIFYFFLHILELLAYCNRIHHYFMLLKPHPLFLMLLQTHLELLSVADTSSLFLCCNNDIFYSLYCYVSTSSLYCFQMVILPHPLFLMFSQPHIYFLCWYNLIL